MNENVTFFNGLLREHIGFERLGFHEVENDMYSNSWKLIRLKNDKIDKIIYSFSKDKWGDDLILHTISASIIFDSVNAILWNVLNEERYLPENHENTIIRFPCFDQESDKYVQQIRDLVFVEKRIVNEIIFNKALGVFKEQLETSVLPFFDKIQTLQEINDEILEKCDWKEWYKYISGLHGVHYFKSIIILKLCNNEKRYNEFTEMYSNLVLDAINNGRTELKELYHNLMVLINYLNNDTHLEIV
jgi:hypothetical protein